VFLDTSVLLGGLIDFGPGVAGAQAVMDRVARAPSGQVLTAWHCCLEFYAVATRLPEEFRLGPSEAGRLVEEEILGRVRVMDLPADARLRLVHDAVRERIGGGRFYDAHIALIAALARARVVVTENLRHFAALAGQGVQVLDSAAFVREWTG
jgi:hypothetical protein